MNFGKLDIRTNCYDAKYDRYLLELCDIKMDHVVGKVEKAVIDKFNIQTEISLLKPEQKGGMVTVSGVLPELNMLLTRSIYHKI